MFALYCRHCDLTYLTSTRSLQSLHNTSDGPVGYACCPHDHLNVVQFRNPRRPTTGDMDRNDGA